MMLNINSWITTAFRVLPYVPFLASCTAHVNAPKKGNSTAVIQSRMIIGASIVLGVIGLSAPATAQNSMVKEILAAHNKYRAEVGVPPIEWSEDLANQAQGWANRLASTLSFSHS